MKKILCVAAHSDDPIIGMGGTIKELAKIGHKIWVISVCSDRIKGFKEAIETLGAIPLFFDFSYNNINENDLVEKLKIIFEKINPDVVFTHWYREILIDHEIVSQQVIKIARKMDKEIFLFEIPASSLNFNFDVAIDITDSYEIRKKAIEIMKGAFDPKVYEEEILPSIIYPPGFRGIQVGCKFSEVFKRFGSRHPLAPERTKILDISKI